MHEDVTIAEPLRKLTERSRESGKNYHSKHFPDLSLAEVWTGFEKGDLVVLKTEDHRFDRFAIRMQPRFASQPGFRDDVCAAKVQAGESILPSIADLGLLPQSA